MLNSMFKISELQSGVAVCSRLPCVLIALVRLGGSDGLMGKKFPKSHVFIFEKRLTKNGKHMKIIFKNNHIIIHFNLIFVRKDF